MAQRLRNLIDNLSLMIKGIIGTINTYLPIKRIGVYTVILYVTIQMLGKISHYIPKPLYDSGGLYIIIDNLEALGWIMISTILSLSVFRSHKLYVYTLAICAALTRIINVIAIDYKIGFFDVLGLFDWLISATIVFTLSIMVVKFINTKKRHKNERNIQ